MRPLIELREIKKQYAAQGLPLTVLDVPFFQIFPGEHVAIVGPSGSGKSTFMHILGCLDAPTAGQYFLNGRDVAQLSADELAQIRNRHIGFVFQSFHLLAYASALENVALPLMYGGVPKDARAERAAALLKRVGLGERLHHKPHQLSGGQCQRAAIARALSMGPGLILADEPTGNLDQASGGQIIQLFEDYVQEGKALIMVTHDLDLAGRAHRVLRICDGRILEE